MCTPAMMHKWHHDLATLMEPSRGLRQIKRTSRRMHRPSAYLLLVAAGVTAAAQCGLAGDASQSRTSAEKLCDSFGPGFVPSGTPGNCVQVQERLRVEPHARRALSPLDGGSAFAPLPLSDDGTLPAHLRLNGGFGRAGLR
jgi:hypothetical protein